jgi:signal transduction histidine kinase
MTRNKNDRQAMLSRLFVGTLFVLCGILGFLQYRWIGEVSVADRDRLGQTLQRSLNRLSQDLNSEIAIACQSVFPLPSVRDASGVQAELTSRFQHWKSTTRHSRIFNRIGLVIPNDETLAVRGMDLETGTFADMPWPDEWSGLRKRVESRAFPESMPGQPPPPPDANGGSASEDLIFEAPVFLPPQPGDRPGPSRQREVAWVVFEINPAYLRDNILPELVQNHLGSAGNLDYQVEVISRASPNSVIWRSDPNQKQSIASTADASVGLLEPFYGQMFRAFSMPGMRKGPGPADSPGPGRALAGMRGPGGRGGPGFAHWEMFVRHRSGSLETLVARTRARNLMVTAGVLLLMIASVLALMRFTRDSQKLASMQMDFVAGVSHELRTPLTVINTAAYNLRGRVAKNPAQVERYGELIQQESSKLKDLVEQVLGFAKVNAGKVLNEPEPVDVGDLIEETIESCRSAIQGANAVVETHVDPLLPPAFADPMALKHALSNLLSNAVKYGMDGSNWIGVTARQTEVDHRLMVEIQVADRGPGIPQDEQKRVFDPFFRGRRALQDQIHGTGLGLNLVKRIVGAHGGSIEMRSAATRGAEFIMRIPAALPEKEHEFANTADRG